MSASTTIAIARAFGVLSSVLALGSPVVLYYAVTAGQIERGALVLLAYAVLRAIPAVASARREQIWAAIRLPLVAVVSALVGLWAHEPRALLVLPSASQIGFSAVFLGSLRGTPLVEHFARMKSPDLAPAQVTYCRTVTKIWGLALGSAALVGFALAIWAPVRVWAAFTTIGSYAIIATVYGTEYTVRRIRFREYGRNPYDRILAALFPSRG